MTTWLRSNVTEAIKDFRYLLSRGYGRESALAFVGDKYQLSKGERLVLYRGIYDRKTSERHKKKLLPSTHIKGKLLAIDGYNSLITVESMLLGKPLFLCNDGFVRDVSAVHGGYRPSERTEKALKLILNFLRSNRPAEVHFFYDAQVSRSGELASLTRSLMKKFGLKGGSQAVKYADVHALKVSKIVAGSDSVVIEKAEKVIDLAGELIMQKAPEKVLKLP